MKAVAVALVGVAVLSAEVGSSTQSRSFQLDDLARIVRVSDPQVAPDGRNVAIVVARADLDTDRWDSQVALVDATSGTMRQVTRGRRGVGHPRWSPDGQSLAFIARTADPADAHTQIFVMSLQGGDAERITWSPTNVQQFAWSPDGKSLAFAAEDERPKRTGREKFDDAFEAGSDNFLTTEAPQPTHAWLVPSSGGPAKRLTSGTWSLPVSLPPGPPSSPLNWSPDGRSIVFARASTPHELDNYKTTLAVVDIASGAIRALTSATRTEGFPSFSPDGSQVAYWYARDGDVLNPNEVYVVPSAGGTPRNLTRTLDRTIFQSAWMPDGRSLLVAGNDVDRTSLWLQTVEGPARRLDIGRVSVQTAFYVAVTVGRTGSIAFIGSEPNRPPELYFMDTPSAMPRRLTDLNRDVAALEFGKVEGVEWRSDGMPHNGVLTYPASFNPSQKYPLVLIIHGGPASASLLSFSAQAQLFAARGWVVFQPNYRGSDQRGQAYYRAIIGDMGAGPGRDVMAGVAAVKARGFVDESRVAVTGWSYGGFMTTWLIGHYDGWRAAMAGAPVTDFVDQAQLSDGGWDEVLGGGPFAGGRIESYRSQSPISYIAKIRTPTLIMSNTGDFRVPITQAYKLYHALKDNNVETKFIAYPIPGHNAADPIRARDVQRRWIEWVEQHFNVRPASH